jgi:predicted dehydrogenase
VERVKVAVVGGSGFMGNLHAKVTQESDSAELVAIVDLNETLGKKAAERYNTRYVQNVDELIADNSAETFIVALPDRLHVDMTVKLLKAGKNVLLEKPMADTLEGARKIAAAEKEGAGRLMIGQLLRFDPRYAQAAQAVLNGEIGDVVHVSAKRYSLRSVGIRMNGKSSVCFYLGIHDVDAMQWVAGKKIKNVFARAVSKVMPEHGVQSEDAIFATFEYEDGTIGSLNISWALPDYVGGGISAGIDIVGTKGILKVDTTDHGLNIQNESGYSLPDGLHWPEVYGQTTGDLKEEVNHFVTAVRDGKPFRISVKEAMQAVAVNDAVLKSVETGTIVEVETI